MIDVRSALKNALPRLNNPNTDARLETEILLGHVLNKNRGYLFAHSELILSQHQLETYQHLITQRSKGIPIAYLTGHREFWSLNLKVTPDTLIPRHETERLVELTLELVTNKPNALILDLGTGTGAIALALAIERPHWNIKACDNSEKALLVAKENAATLGINNVTFYHSDWFTNLPKLRYDAIISNPPYIALKDSHLNQGDIQFEPQNALVSGQDGLADLQYIIQHSCDHLLPNGLLLLEHGCEQKEILRAILKQFEYKKISCWKDIQGHDRVSGGWRSDASADGKLK